MTPETVALPVGPAAPPPPPACAAALLPLPALALPEFFPPHPQIPAARTTAPSTIRLIVPPCVMNHAHRRRSALGAERGSRATSPIRPTARSSRSVRRRRASASAHRDKPRTTCSPRRESRPHR